MMLELPVEGVKIDMFFVKDILEEKKKQALVIGMINFTNAADLKICIEGIENDSLESYLRPVSYTHLDVYKRQHDISLRLSDFSLRTRG